MKIIIKGAISWSKKRLTSCLLWQLLDNFLLFFVGEKYILMTGLCAGTTTFIIKPKHGLQLYIMHTTTYQRILFYNFNHANIAKYTHLFILNMRQFLAVLNLFKFMFKQNGDLKNKRNYRILSGAFFNILLLEMKLKSLETFHNENFGKECFITMDISIWKKLSDLAILCSRWKLNFINRGKKTLR